MLTGCAITAPYQRPELELPSAWEAPAAAEAVAEGDWWSRFGSPELIALQARALAENRDLAAALSRIAQARASLATTGAGALPSVDASGSASRNYRDDTGRTVDSDQWQLAIGYELDLWGAQRARTTAARATLAAREYDYAALALTLQADVAQHYFTALALTERRALAQRNLQSAREILELVELRYREGAAGGLELAQQRSAVASLEAQIPQLAQQEAATRTALAVLLGQPPQGFELQPATWADLQLPAIAAGQPAELLQRRPDIRRAEAELIAASADIAVARAAFYPSVRLSASAGVTGLLTSGSTTLAALAASLTQPIFAGGRLRGQLELSQARREELVFRYGQTVLGALKEVEDALVALHANELRVEALGRAATEAREAYRLATVRYEEGAVDLLTVLDAQRSRLQAEDSLVQAELARLTAATTLFRALGGRWAQDA